MYIFRASRDVLYSGGLASREYYLFNSGFYFKIFFCLCCALIEFALLFYFFDWGCAVLVSVLLFYFDFWP
jgi:hypothetical protein